MTRETLTQQVLESLVQELLCWDDMRVTTDELGNITITDKDNVFYACNVSVVLRVCDAYSMVYRGKFNVFFTIENNVITVFVNEL